MQFFRGVLGDFDRLIGPEEMTLRETVALPLPPAAGSRVQAFLSGFDVGYDNADRNLQNIRVELEAYSFGNSTEVEVIARITLRDKEQVFEPIRAQVSYTLLAE